MGAGVLAFALPKLLGSFAEAGSHAPLVTLDPHIALGVPLALGCFSLGGITLTRPGERIGRRLLAVVFVAVVLAVIAVPVTEIAAGLAMSGRGYERCGPQGVRHVKMQWVRPGGRCP